MDLFISYLPTCRSWLIAYVATVVLEGAIVAVYARIFKHDVKKMFIGNFAGNTISHPTAFLIIVPLLRTLNSSHRNAVIVAEACVVIIETFVLKRIVNASYLRSFLIAFLANLTSWQLGNLLWKLIF